MTICKQSKMSKSSIPNKGDIIISPLTSRPIRVGGRIWLGLVKKGLVEGRYTDPKELSQSYTDETIGEDIERINKTLPRGQQSVRGRGKYKGKIVSRNVKPNTEEVSRYTAQMASRIINENIDHLAEFDDMEAELERLILEEMAGGMGKKKVVNKPVGRGRGRPPKQQPVEQQFMLEEPQEYDDEEHDEDDEEIDYFQDEEYSE